MSPITSVRPTVRGVEAAAVGSNVPAPSEAMPVVEQILDLARWAPSGDNSQPWRFQVLSDRDVAVHAFDTLYEADAQARAVATNLVGDLAIA